MFAVSVFGQDQDVFRPAETSSPRATLKSFLDSTNALHAIIVSDGYFDRTSAKHRPLARRVLDCLDLSEIPAFARDERAGEVAICLKEILDRVAIPPIGEIPDTEAINQAGGPESLSRWQIPGTRIAIHRVEEGMQEHEYLFSKGTVDRAVEYFTDMQSAPYRTTGPPVSEGFYDWYVTAPANAAIAGIVDRLPAWMHTRVLTLAIWKWCGLILVITLGYSLMGACYVLFRSLAIRTRGKQLFRYCLTIVFPIAAMLVPFMIRHVVQVYLTVRGMPLYVIGFATTLTAVLASLVVVFGISGRIAELIILSPHIHPQGLDAQLIRIVSRLTSLVVAVIVFLVGGQYLGIALSTLLASAGVGGLAVALAAQDTLKNLFGTLMLMTDKPFRVGERIVFGKYDGVVEDIGLRSTRIRLLIGHQTTIPNEELARSDIENVGRRPYIRRLADLRVPLITTREDLAKAVEIVRSALCDHEGMIPDNPPRVHFNEIHPDGYNIRMIYWYSPPNYWDFLTFSERLNFEILRQFEEHGIQFTMPSRIAVTSTDSRAAPLDIRVVSDHEGSQSADWLRTTDESPP